ncbi:transcriptional regulator [Neobacillus sp. 19]|uniref:transcriptional regulator n=1 Tax=Neobacillus sp. 19 TaxID=3394458 RepID=UPI003BF641EA
MTTKIAVIGSNEFINNILAIAADLPDIEIDPYIYQEPAEAEALVTQLKPCDVVFFSGALPYYFSKKNRELLPIPSHCLATDEMAVASTFLSILYTKKIALGRISIDLIDSSVVTNVLAELESDLPEIQILAYRQMVEGHFDLSKIVAFHQALWDQGEIDLAITSVHAIYHRLNALGIPVKRIIDPKISLRRGLENARAMAELYKRKASQVAVGYISAKALFEHISVFTAKFHASAQQLDENLFVFYSTRGEIESLIDQNILTDFLDNWQDPCKIGFGYGKTLTDAEQNAMVALQFAEKDETGKCGYILTEEKQLLGPFPHDAKQHHLKHDDPKIVQVAKQTKLSPANLSKIIEFSKSRTSVHFTAADLSEYLHVTRRSTERIIKKLADHGYVKNVGEEMTYQQGRPRAIYELNLPVYY